MKMALPSQITKTVTSVISNENSVKTITKQNLRIRVSCGNCNENFASFQKFHHHCQTKHESEAFSYRCPNCCKKFLSEKSLRKHKKICISVDDSLPAKCEVCGRVYPSKHSLKNHSIHHSSATPFKCEICEKEFRTKVNLKTHIKTHVPKSLRDPIDCKICDKSFTAKSGYVSHMKLHNNCRPTYLCEICGFQYNTLGGLNLHQKHHWGESNFVCHICGKSFTNKAYSELHVKLHTMDLSHSCEICGKLFNRRGTYKHHLLVHKEVKPHECRFCKNTFRTRFNLKTHERTHTGAKPYTCHLCLKAFSQNVSLRNHMKYHDSDEEQNTIATDSKTASSDSSYICKNAMELTNSFDEETEKGVKNSSIRASSPQLANRSIPDGPIIITIEPDIHLLKKLPILVGDCN